MTEPTELRATAVKGASQMAIATNVARLASFASLLVLSRVLSPSDFGVAAIAILLGGFLTNFSDFGLSSTIIGYGLKADTATFRRAARIRAVASASLFATLFIAADVLASLLGAPQAADAIRVQSFVLLIAGAAFAPLTDLNRRRDFGSLALARNASTLTQASVAIALALTLQSYWAIVLSVVVGSSVSTTVLWARWDRRITSGSEVIPSRKLLTVGFLLTLSWLASYALFSADRAFVSARLGAEQLGYYAIAFQWACIVADTTSPVLGAVALPTYSSIADDDARLRAAYLTSIRLVAFIAIPSTFGLFFVAPELLIVILGGSTDKWAPALNALRILLAVGIMRSILEPVVGLIIAKKAVLRYWFQAVVPLGVLGVGLLAISSSPSIEWVAVSMAFAYLSNFAIGLWAIGRIIGVKASDFGASVVAPLLSGFVMAGVLTPIRLYLGVSALSMVVLVAAGIAAYFAGFMIPRSRAALSEFWAVASAVYRAIVGSFVKSRAKL